jgi:ribosomal protein L29
MKKKELNELRGKSVKELRKLASDKRGEAEKVKMKIFAGKEKNLKLKRNLTREVAKILTLIREKEIIESLEVKKPEVKEEKKEEKGKPQRGSA